MYPVIERSTKIITSWHPSFMDAVAAIKRPTYEYVGKVPLLPPMKGGYPVNVHASTVLGVL